MMCKHASTVNYDDEEGSDLVSSSVHVYTTLVWQPPPHLTNESEYCIVLLSSLHIVVIVL